MSGHLCDSTAFTRSSSLTLHIEIYTASRGFPAQQCGDKNVSACFQHGSCDINEVTFLLSFNVAHKYCGVGDGVSENSESGRDRQSPEAVNCMGIVNADRRSTDSCSQLAFRYMFQDMTSYQMPDSVIRYPLKSNRAKFHRDPILTTMP